MDKGGAHSQFKAGLKEDLLKRVESTVKKRAGPSWDERMEKAVKGFQAKARASETEMKKNLTEAVERGRARETSCPIRSASETPNQQAMLAQRKKQMRDLELEYREQLDVLRDKMEKREPLFRLSEVNSAFAEQKARMAQKKREMAQDEHERWEHMKSLEAKAASRPLLIEGLHHVPKERKTPAASQSAPNLDAGTPSSRAGMGDREVYPKDEKIRQAVSTKWFQQSAWGREVAEIKDRANNRKKLHEIDYPHKGDRHALTRDRLRHSLPAQVPAVY